MVTRTYSIAGVDCTVSSDTLLLELIDASYGAFRVGPDDREDGYRLSVERVGAGVRLADSRGNERTVEHEQEALVRALDLIVQRVIGGLADQGVYAIHAASLARCGRGLIVSGPSGAGKSTIALGLVARGLQILSDELALVSPDAHTLLPYRRSVHIRPGTPELIGELAFLQRRPRYELGGGNEWSLLPDELETVFPGCLGGPAQVTHALLVEQRNDGGESALEPVPSALAAVELLRATPAAADDFGGVLQRFSTLAGGLSCARLRPGTLESSLDLIVDWFESGGEPEGA